ncbi:Interferon-induced, double-stranded RNA-activated protein kinase [Bulinus truncatus]|nr:Interferon-induced, double-stranded RNA-activated protein kinase [Bulinus truncatus]
MACHKDTPETDASLDSLIDSELSLSESSTNHSNVACLTTNDQSSSYIKLDCGKRFGQDYVVQDLYKKLGSGISGEVFEARKKLDNKKYAIKRIKSKNENQIREVKNLAKLEHPNIVRYFTAWIDGDWLYIQLELCKSTLSDWLFKMKQRNKETLAKYFQQIISAVEFIHKNDLMHRDLKPSNIFFAENDDLKIGDFGLSTVHTEPNENLTQTDAAACSVEHSQMKGTPDYMSPEQLEGKTDYDTRTDIYSLGLIFLEMYTVTNYDEKIDIFKNAREYGEYPKQVKLPPEKFKELLDGMLAKNPEKRWSATQILENFTVSKTAESKSRMTVNTGMITGNVMIGDNNTMEVYGSTNTKKQLIKKPATKPITNSKENPTKDQLLDIKNIVGNNWKDLGRRLSFNDAYLEQMKIDSGRDIGELVYQILLKWIQREAKNASKAKLAEIFLKLDRGDLADLLAD